MSKYVQSRDNEEQEDDYRLPMLMIKCKTCGEVFPGLFVPEGNSNEFKTSATSTDTPYTCSISHKNLSRNTT